MFHRQLLGAHQHGVLTQELCSPGFPGNSPIVLLFVAHYAGGHSAWCCLSGNHAGEHSAVCCLLDTMLVGIRLEISVSCRVSGIYKYICLLAHAAAVWFKKSVAVSQQ